MFEDCGERKEWKEFRYRDTSYVRFPTICFGCMNYKACVKEAYGCDIDAP